MAIFKDNVSGEDKKHILWQHYVNGEYFISGTDDHVVHDDPGLVLPVKQGGKKINPDIISEWLERIFNSLEKDKALVLRAVYLLDGPHAKDGVFDENGQLKNPDEFRKLIVSQIETRERLTLRGVIGKVSSATSKVMDYASSSMMEDDYPVKVRKKPDYTNHSSVKICMNLAASKKSVEQTLKASLHEKMTLLTSTKEKASKLFVFLAGFAAGAAPGVTVGALGYSIALGVGFALATTPVGWLIAGAAVVGLLGAVAAYAVKFYKKKQDNKSHLAIYNKNNQLPEQLEQINNKLTVISNDLNKAHQEIKSLRAENKLLRQLFVDKPATAAAATTAMKEKKSLLAGTEFTRIFSHTQSIDSSTEKKEEGMKRVHSSPSFQSANL